MNTSNKFEQQAAEALQRINEHTNRSAGQHVRAVRRVRASQPVKDEALPPVALRRVDPGRIPVEFAGEEPESDGGMHMLAYLFVALVLTCAVIGIGFVAGRYFS